MDHPEIDWVRARDLVRAFVARRSRGPAVDDVEDLANMVLEKMVRLLSRGAVDRPEAVLMTIARRTLIDYWRRKTAERSRFEQENERSRTVPGQDEDPLERLQDRQAEVRWVVLAYLRKHSAKCHDLAVAYFAEQAWDELAGKMKKSAGALKREWHRCVERMVRSASRNPRSTFLELRS